MGALDPYWPMGAMGKETKASDLPWAMGNTLSRPEGPWPPAGEYSLGEARRSIFPLLLPRGSTRFTRIY